MQNDAAESLVRSPATPLYANQSHSLEEPSLIASEVQPQPVPTPGQPAALSELLVFDDEKIFAYLTVLRSIEPSFRSRAPRECLSDLQLEALATLIDWGDSDILTWLALSRSASGVSRQRKSNSTVSISKPPFVSPSRHRRRPSTNSSLRSSTSSLAHSAVFSSNSSYGTPRSSLGCGTSLPEVPEGTASNDEPKHNHWCTYGEHPKPTTTCEGWKRHEREHESGYLCMPNGSVINTQHGQICVLCGQADPDADHQAWHNTSTCAGKFIKKSRRSDMITHLAYHHVHGEVGVALAEQWRYDSNKKCFSCGFCVVIFPSILERSNHIDNEHWKYGQTMGSWEFSNLIRGLLLEPKVQAAWRVLLRSYPYLVESNLRWEMPLAQGLQLRLEKCEESGRVLAIASLECSNYEQIRPENEGLMARMSREQVMFGLGSATPPSPADVMMSLDQPSQLLPGSSPSMNIGGSSTAFQYPQCDPSLNIPAFSNLSFQPDDFRNYPFVPPKSLMNLNVSGLPSQLSNHACPRDWPSMDSNQPVDDGPQLQNHLNENGALLLAQISSPRHDHPATYPTVDEQGPHLDPRNYIQTFNATRLPTSKFFYGSTAQLSHHEYGLNFRKKPLPPNPLPDLPNTNSRAAGHRLTTPMDLDAR